MANTSIYYPETLVASLLVRTYSCFDTAQTRSFTPSRTGATDFLTNNHDSQRSAAMQVLNPNTGLLSNAEVLKILREDDEESKLASNSIRDRRYQDRKLQRALGKFEHGWNKAEVNKLANPPALSDMRKDVSIFFILRLAWRQ